MHAWLIELHTLPWTHVNEKKGLQCSFKAGLIFVYQKNTKIYFTFFKDLLLYLLFKKKEHFGVVFIFPGIYNWLSIFTWTGLRWRHLLTPTPGLVILFSCF